jgi:hypothetical protein
MAEVAGLASMITVLETVLKTLLIIIFSNPMVSISPVVFLKNPDPQSPVLMLLALLNPMTFWLLAVRSTGLARFTGVSWTRAAAWVFGVWIVMTGILVALAIAMQMIFSK